MTIPLQTFIIIRHSSSHDTVSPTSRHRRLPASPKPAIFTVLTNSFPFFPLPAIPISNSHQSQFDFAKHSNPEASIFDRRETEP
ncbi:hypothetical protein VNO77_12725 [Canavalia gladiata]|uniref:Uncharacterized protein n=1 Tax=Canavalia gladiata TaxID=3824 RepID=A0AAN9M1V2_CANGL